VYLYFDKSSNLGDTFNNTSNWAISTRIYLTNLVLKPKTIFHGGGCCGRISAPSTQEIMLFLVIECHQSERIFFSISINYSPYCLPPLGRAYWNDNKAFDV
jgi:hypothetical protein